MTRTQAEMQLRRAIRVQSDIYRPRGSHETTEAIAHAVGLWLRALGAERTARNVSAAYRMDGRLIAGRVAVAGYWASGARMAVEIDGSHKPRSLAKLEAMRDAGWRVAWVRWDKSPAFPDVPVHCIWVRAAVTAHRRERQQRQAPLF